MHIEEMKRRKAEVGYTNEQIAKLSGVPLSTVQKIFAGVTSKPRYDTLLALEAVLYPETAETKGSQASRVREAAQTALKNQGHYTLEDYYALPGEQRAELIDGTIYFLSAPSTVHQRVQFSICRALEEFIRSHQGTCIPFMAPCDVQLREDREEIFEPDIFVVCDPKKIHRKRIVGAPDLVIEILSPSSRKKDMVLKLGKYTEGGVREYWLVDPDERRIVVYLPEEDFNVQIYGFEDQVPVGIFENECKVDFKEIYESNRFFFELEEE